jgi:hypothetical protein
MTMLMQASNQWSTRPADERFVSLIDLASHTSDLRSHSKQTVVSTRKLQVAPIEDDNTGLVVVGPNGNPVMPTHWSFGQMAALSAIVPANALRKLSAPLAADCINYGLRQRDVEEVQCFLQRDESHPIANLAAMTGPNYGRIYNSEIANALVKRFGDGLTGDFRVPGEFGKHVEVTKANTTIYAGDRDMFVFLADEEHRVETLGRRNLADGTSLGGSFARGVFIWNSEVGSQTFGIASFLFDYVCCNRIVWGAREFKEIRLRHTSGAPDRFIEQVQPAIARYAQGSTNSIVKAIEDAKAKRIGDQDEVNEFLAKRFAKSEVKAINLAHFVEEQRPIETIWDAVTGITAAAKNIHWQDDRVDMERKAGLIMDMAA